MQPAVWRSLFWIAVVAGLVLSLRPVPEQSAPWFSGADKLEHACAFAVLWLLGTRAGVWRWPVLALGLLALGAAIEVLQAFTPTRTAGFDDWLADAVGVATGCFVDRIRQRRSGSQP